MKKLLIEIECARPNSWYRKRVGEQFWVLNASEKYYCSLKKQHGPMFSFLIKKIHCKIIQISRSVRQVRKL